MHMLCSPGRTGCLLVLTKVNISQLCYFGGMVQMYAPVLESQSITLEQLLWMGDEDLGRLGVLPLGHRQAIRRALWEHILRHLRLSGQH